jgi:hypothetical protein
MRIIIAMVAVLLVIVGAIHGRAFAEDRSGQNDQCGSLYTDEEAKGLIHPAEKAIPAGKALAKKAVLNKLGIDLKRLCNRQVQQFNLGYVERWRLSQLFDLVWSAAVQDPTPLERDDRRIFHVRVIKHSDPLPPREDANKAESQAKGAAKRSQGQ